MNIFTQSDFSTYHELTYVEARDEKASVGSNVSRSFQILEDGFEIIIKTLFSLSNDGPRSDSHDRGTWKAALWLAVTELLITPAQAISHAVLSPITCGLILYDELLPTTRGVIPYDGLNEDSAANTRAIRGIALAISGVYTVLGFIFKR